MKSVEQVTREAVESGGVLALLYFDVHGNSKEVVQNTMVEFVSRITKERGVIYAVGEIEEIIELNEMFSTSAEVKVLTKDFASLVGIAVLYSPIGVEVLEPHSIRLSIPEAQSIILNAAQTSQEFATFVLDRIMKPDELAEFKKKMAGKAELGKRLMERKKDAK
ncbi:MAG: hypothetical protein AB1468_06905 [Candidatus Micrarchaeota archaeon]